MLGPGWRSLVCALVLSLAACSQPEVSRPERARWVVIGIDGAEWSVIRELWDEGRLLNLKALAERGVSTSLRTDYAASPVIWTTIATGRSPEHHGITGFAVPTESGDVPVSSRLRKVPALWNMLTAAERQVAVLSWWASWPAESIAGVVLTDRYGLGIGEEFTPTGLVGDLEVWDRRAQEVPNNFGGNPRAKERDHYTAVAAEELVARDYDLVLAYFRGVDIESHHSWKYWRPERFPEVGQEELERNAHRIPEVYEATDQAIGRIVRAAGPEVNVAVLSDHGFHARVPEEVRIQLDFDRVLERLGYQARTDDGIDWDNTALYTFATAHFRLPKRVRFADSVPSGERDEVRARLTGDLDELRYESGERAFRVRDATPREARTGADFTVVVQNQQPTQSLLRGDERWDDLIGSVTRISGTHSARTHGIFLAAGPDVDVNADLEGLSIHDITPTLLYALGLPTAEDLEGRAYTALLDEEFRRRHPERSIASWAGAVGTGSDPATPLRSSADEELVDELRALGYIE